MAISIPRFPVYAALLILAIAIPAIASSGTWTTALAAETEPAAASPLPESIVVPHAMPLDPEIVERYMAGGKPVPEEMTERKFMQRFGEGAEAAINRLPASSVTRLSPRPQGGGESLQRPGGKSASGGAAGLDGAQPSQMLKAIVILVKFQDDPPGGPTVRYTPGVWDSMLFGEFYVRGEPDTTTGKTLSRFLREISYGDVDIMTLNMPSTVGWVTAPNNYAYYCEADGVHDNGFGPYPRNAQRLVMDAVLAADPYVDFSQYAVRGVVENLFIVHAGSGAEWSGGSVLIWSHSWAVGVPDGWGNSTPPLFVDGVQVFGYSMEPEAGGDVLGEAGPPTGPILPTVGVYAHEFGHILGLPDEYDYGYESQGTGRISLMASGSWNRCPDVYPYCAGNSPSHMSALQTAWLGFVTPVEVTATTLGVSIPAIETTPVGAMYKVTYPGTDGKEYWLFENRQQIGFDEGFIRMTGKAHGLCVYHVDENVFERIGWLPNEAECVSHNVYVGYPRNCDCDTLPPNPNNGEKWYGISVEQADGLYQLELGTSGGNWQDFYSSASGASTFNASSRPNSSSYYTVRGCAGVPALLNITEAGGYVTLDVVPHPVAQAVLEPAKVNLKSQGSWVTVKVGFDAPYQASEIDPASVTLAGVQADPGIFEVGRNQNGSGTAILKFDRGRVAQAILDLLAETDLKSAQTLSEGTSSAALGLGSESGATVSILLQGLVAKAYFDCPVSVSVVDASGEPRVVSSETATAAPGETRVVWWLPRAGGVRIHVLTETEGLVKVLVDGFQSAGFHTSVWDGTDRTGTKVGPGTYVLKMETRGGTALLKFSR